MRVQDILRIASSRMKDKVVQLTRRPKYVVLIFRASESAAKEVEIGDLEVKFSDYKPNVRVRDRDQETELIKKYMQRS